MQVTIAEVDELTFAARLVSGAIDAAVAWDRSVLPGLHARDLLRLARLAESAYGLRSRG